MVAGLALTTLSGLRLRSELWPPPGGATTPPSASDCTNQGCRANDDPRPARGYEVPAVAVGPADPDHMVVTDINLVGGHCGWHVTFDGGREWTDGVFELPPGFRQCRLDSGGFLPLGNVAVGPSGTIYTVLASARVDEQGRPTEGESVLLARSGDGGRSFSPATVAVPGGPPTDSWLRPALTAAPGPSGSDRLLISFWGCRPPSGAQPGICDRALFAQSRDAGATFSEPVVVNDDPAGFSPSGPAVGADGSVYVLFLRRFNDGIADVLLARSVDDGASFSVTAVDRQPRVGLTYDSAKLEVAPDGRTLYTVFSDNRTGDPDVYFRRSTDGGRTWDQAVRLNRDPAGSSYLPWLSVAPGGRIDVVFYQRRVEDTDDVQWTYSTDGGETFARDLQINEDSIDRQVGYWFEVGDSYPPRVASSEEAAYVVWSDSAAGTAAGTAATDTQDTFLRRMAIDPGP